MQKNERLDALRILVNLLTKKLSLSYSLQSSVKSSLTKEICFGVCRHFFRLQAIAEQLIKKKPQDSEVWVAILMGLYQLQWMKLPDYAVVKETVDLLDLTKKKSAKAFVNAVLRNFCRRQSEILTALTNNPQFIYGHPQWLLKRLKSNWPHHWQQICKANEEHPPLTLRVNIQKNSVEGYLRLLEKANLQACTHPFAKEAIILEKPVSVDELPQFKQGQASVQDAAAQLAVSLLKLKPGHRVLDACCAPGGKMCHILESEPDLEACIGLDIDDLRLQKVKNNLERLELEGQLVQGNAAGGKEWWDKKQFDRILLDAPCSATGVIRRHSDIKILRTEKEITAIKNLQAEILTNLWPLLKSKGIMVYATCSIMPDENEKQIENFVAKHPDCITIHNEVAWGLSGKYGYQILPGEQGMDGFYYAILQKQ